MNPIAENRRRRLKLWTETHSIPPAEKSYFSQLINGVGSFGEKAARRLEEKYQMGNGFLDAQEALPGNNVKASIKGQFRPLSAVAKQLILCVIRLDGAPDKSQTFLKHHAALLGLAEDSLGLHHSRTGQNTAEVESLLGALAKASEGDRNGKREREA
jgi:hypothetical protein